MCTLLSARDNRYSVTWESSGAGDGNLVNQRLRRVVVFLFQGPAAPLDVDAAGLRSCSQHRNATRLSLLPRCPPREGKGVCGPAG